LRREGKKRGRERWEKKKKKKPNKKKGERGGWEGSGTLEGGRGIFLRRREGGGVDLVEKGKEDRGQGGGKRVVSIVFGGGRWRPGGRRGKRGRAMAGGTEKKKVCLFLRKGGPEVVGDSG